MNSQSKTSHRFGSESQDLIIYPPLDSKPSLISKEILDANTSEEASDASNLINEARSAIFQTSNMTVAERAKQAQDILKRQNDSFRKAATASKVAATAQASYQLSPPQESELRDRST